MREVLLLLSSLLLLNSCEKLGIKNTSIRGQVINVVTGEPLEGIKISISGITSGPVGGNVDRVGIITTDTNGFFEHSFFADWLKSYSCLVSSKDNPNLNHGLGSAGNYSEHITKGEENIFEFRIAFAGYIKERIVNVNCDPSIILEITKANSVPESIKNLTFEIDNCRSLIRKEFHSYPVGKHHYIWRTIRDGQILTENRDSFVLEVGERKEYTIEY